MNKLTEREAFEAHLLARGFSTAAIQRDADGAYFSIDARLQRRTWLDAVQWINTANNIPANI